MPHRTTSLPTLLFLGLLLQLAGQAYAQFGVPKAVKQGGLPEQLQAEIDAAGSGGQQREGVLSPQDAADMEELIKKAKADPETAQMISKMKADAGEELERLGREPAEDILGGMKQALDEMKMLDVLFRDKKRALREMDREGMIDKAHLKKYQKDPDLLESDTRKGLYFQFVSLAVAGGYL